MLTNDCGEVGPPLRFIKPLLPLDLVYFAAARDGASLHLELVAEPF